MRGRFRIVVKVCDLFLDKKKSSRQNWDLNENWVFFLS